MSVQAAFVAAGLIALIACGATDAPQTAAVPTPKPEVVTVLVTQVVTRVATQVVTQIVTATPAPATPTPKVEPTATSLPVGKWVVDSKKSSLDDSTTVTVALDAEADISGPTGDVRPTLIVRCQERKKEVYIYTGMPPSVEAGNLDGATVRIRFDSEPAITDNAGQSTSNDSLFLSNPAKLIQTIGQHERMVFEFTPFDAGRTEMTFHLRGFSEAVKPLNEACK